MLRGYEKMSYADAEYCDHSLKYNVWYEMVTPFEGFYFRLKKGSNKVVIYRMYPWGKVIKVCTKKQFRERWSTIVKSPIKPLKDHELHKWGLKGYGYQPKNVLFFKLERAHGAIMRHKKRFTKTNSIKNCYEHYIGWYDAFKPENYKGDDFDSVNRLITYVDELSKLFKIYYVNEHKSREELKMILDAFGNLYSDLVYDSQKLIKGDGTNEIYR